MAVDIASSGHQANFHVTLPGDDAEATLYLKLDGGTGMIADVMGAPDLSVELLEVAQNVCEEVWRKTD